jgi:hypothetical protein
VSERPYILAELADIDKTQLGLAGERFAGRKFKDTGRLHGGSREGLEGT